MVNIVNAGQLGGGFRHYSGLLPVNPATHSAHVATSVRPYHVAATNAAAIFRGDIITYADATHGVPGGGDMIQNIGAPSASPVIGNGGGSLLGNTGMNPNAARWTPGDTTAVILGVCVGFGPISLFQAKNGFQYIPATTEAWVWVETDPDIEMQATVPTVPGTAFNLQLGSGIDVMANAPQQSTRFGISGVSLNPATLALTATLPLRVTGSGDMIGNDTLAAGFVAKVQFNKTRHFRGTAAFVAD